MHLNFYRNLNLVVLKKVEEVRFMSRYSMKLAYVESVSNKFPLTLVKSSGKKKGRPVDNEPGINVAFNESREIRSGTAGNRLVKALFTCVIPLAVTRGLRLIPAVYE